MKKHLIGILSVILLFASIFGLSSKGTRDRRSVRSGNGPDWAMWV
jgi:hypothetical protein